MRTWLYGALLLTSATHPVAADEHVGAAVKGLAVTLAPETSTHPVGAMAEFEATITNVSNQPFLIDLFGDLNEVYQGKRYSSYVLSCWTLSWADGLSSIGIKRGRYTLETNQFLRLAPGTSYTKHLVLRLTDIPPGIHRVKLAYTPRAANASFSFPNRWQSQHGLRNPMWLGMAYSNEVTIAVVSAR